MRKLGVSSRKSQKDDKLQLMKMGRLYDKPNKIVKPATSPEKKPLPALETNVIPLQKSLTSFEMKKNSNWPKDNNMDIWYNLSSDHDIESSFDNRDKVNQQEESNNTIVDRQISRKFNLLVLPNGVEFDLYDVPIRSQKALNKVCKPFLPLIPCILKGKTPSPFYNRAKEIFQKSNSVMLQRSQLDASIFTAGFYGLKRQIWVSQLILKEFRDTLQMSKSPIVRWWGVDDFARYVLAPEILSLLAMSDLGLPTACSTFRIEQIKDLQWFDSRIDLLAIFQDTIEFGVRVADCN